MWVQTGKRSASEAIQGGFRRLQNVSECFRRFHGVWKLSGKLHEKFWGYYSGFKAFQWDFRTLQKVSVIHFFFFKDLKLRSLVRV